jgi:hypothetical protein
MLNNTPLLLLPQIDQLHDAPLFVGVWCVLRTLRIVLWCAICSYNAVGCVARTIYSPHNAIFLTDYTKTIFDVFAFCSWKCIARIEVYHYSHV